MHDRYAVFGHPLAHSRSPRVYAAFGLDFELIDVAPDGFVDAFRRFGREGGRGGNVTLPHKLAAAGLADALSQRARQAGAVNAFRFETDGILFGDNTDGAGLVADLTVNMGLDIKGKRILVLGAGGAARGILGPLLDCAPAELVLANRDAGKAQALAGRFAAQGRVRATGLEAPGKAFDLVINATSASVDDAVPAVPASVFDAGSIAYDLFYTDDGETAFTRWAMAHGAGAAVDGWGMLVEQAAESCLLWLGKRPETSTLLSRGA